MPSPSFDPETDVNRADTLDNLDKATVPELAVAGPTGRATDVVAPGTVLDGVYEVREKLGEGGMGQVYEAYDRSLGRRVAIKLCWPHVNPDSLRDEAQALAAFRHPSMITVHALGSVEGRPYVVMERVYGVDLWTFLDRRRRDRLPLSVAEVVDVSLALADALGELHRAGLAHRDLKPANVMLAPGGRVVLMDFGLSHSESRGVPASVAGTPEYIAPELMTAAVDPRELFRVDLYSLGILLYELLTFAPPFLGSTAEVLRKQVEDEVPRIDRDDVPRALTALLRELLLKDPFERPSGMDAVAFRLRKLRNETSPTRESTEPFRVLVVDDDPDIARLVRYCVLRAVPTAQVDVLHDAERALERLQVQVVDLLLLDLQMPRMNGIELCMYLRGTHHADRCTIVPISAGAQEHDRQLLRQLGINRFVGKGDGFVERLMPLIRELERLPRGHDVSVQRG